MQITWSFAKSNIITGLYAAPGNAGTAEHADNLPEIDPCDSDMVIETCRKYKIDVVFVGPEAPLAAGIVDALHDAGIKAIGPHKEAAMLESSKAFSKDFMIKYNIPTADAKEFDNSAEI